MCGRCQLSCAALCPGGVIVVRVLQSIDPVLCCLQGAINWLAEHEGDEHLDEPLLVPKVGVCRQFGVCRQ